MALFSYEHCHRLELNIIGGYADASACNNVFFAIGGYAARFLPILGLPSPSALWPCLDGGGF
jgi:hypothetical protein